jgi:hypothetical protein
MAVRIVVAVTDGDWFNQLPRRSGDEASRTACCITRTRAANLQANSSSA